MHVSQMLMLFAAVLADYCECYVYSPVTPIIIRGGQLGAMPLIIIAHKSALDSIERMD